MIIKAFGGIVPRTPWHLLPDGAATVAHDVKLRNGKLEPWRERLAISPAVQDAVSVHMHGCCPYTFDKCVDMAEYVTDYGRLFVTGRQDYPEVGRIRSDCDLEYSRLGVPQPSKAPAISGSASVGRECAERMYVYTYVNKFGEEGAPSAPSSPVTVADGDPVTVTGFVTPPEEYEITHINVYRSATVWRSGEEKAQEPGTEYLLVYTIPISYKSYTDTIEERMLGTAINTENTREPPSDLRHITYLRGTGVLAGVTNNQVHFCQPYQPYNWPAEYDLTLPANIVNCVALGSMLFVSTDNSAYVIKGAPSCEPHQCRDVTEVLTPLPDVSCGHTNSAIATPFGMVYSSKDGLVLVMPDAKFQVITSAWFSTDDWVKIRPDTARLAYWRGYLICVTDVISFMLEVDSNTYNDASAANLVTISDRPVCMTTTSTDELIMLEDGMLWQWNAGSTYRPYKWVSKEVDTTEGTAGESTPTTAKIMTDGVTLKIIDHEGNHCYERFIPDVSPVRLKRLGRQLKWRMSLSGKGTVEYAALSVAYNAGVGL